MPSPCKSLILGPKVHLTVNPGSQDQLKKYITCLHAGSAGEKMGKKIIE